MSGLKIVQGADLQPHIAELARLRMRVFREYPYLYQGTETYEAEYLHTYMQSPRAMAALAFDGDDIIGASTGIPMADEEPAFQKPFLEKGMDPEGIFYCGESVLLPEFRGRGLYKGFFKAREDYARNLGLKTLCFCAVVREEGDPRKPADYQPLEPVWQHFGYQPRPDLIAWYHWTEVGGTEDIDHPMMFWIKSLD